MGHEQTPEQVIADEADYLQSQLNRYKEGYNILMEYWDSIPDEEKDDVSRRLNNLGI